MAERSFSNFLPPELVAVLWQNGAIVDLNQKTSVPDGWKLVHASAINDNGQIAATAVDGIGRRHDVLLTPNPNRPPVATCAGVTVAANASCQAPASIDNGSSDPDGDQITLAQAPAGPYSLGTTSVTLTVTDPGGASASCTANVIVQDQTGPVVTCPAPTQASANDSCKAPIPNVLAGVTGVDNCTAAAGLATIQSPEAGGLVGLGTFNIGVTATDASSNPGFCATTFTVQDTTAPAVTSTVSVPVLWSPAHELVNVGFSASANDNCEGAPALNAVVYSNEPDQPASGEDANFSPDANAIAPGTLRLRNERSPTGNGRIYLISSRATDGAGNAGVSCATVMVPRDQKNQSLAAVSSLAASAQQYCTSHDGAAPAGYVPVGIGPVVGPKQ